MKKFGKMNENGFTLIELMIVMAIIGILAAIAIPNYMSYRDKGQCSRTEADARSVSTAIANWYSDPSHTALVKTDDLNLTLSGKNTIAIEGTIDAVKVIVTDGSGRCPNGIKYVLTIPLDAGDGWVKQ